MPIARTLRSGRVISVGRNAAWVVFNEETEPQVASLRKGDRHTMIVPGDVVDAQTLEDGRVVVDRVHDRAFVLERRTGGGRTKVMAANLDTLAIVAALVDPVIHLGFIDRLIASATLHELHAMLVLTKPDLGGPALTESVAAIYGRIGYPVLVVQPKSGEGIAGLREAIAQRHALLVGNSGVGKSSIFRALGGTSVVGDLNRFGTGKQTTSTARLFQMGEGFLIDSPGIGDFAIEPLPAAEASRLFVEIAALAGRCRFTNCRHLVEPGCAIRDAVESEAIASSRYESYREMVAAAGS